MKLLNIKINAESENKTKTVVNARNFKIIVDEPEELAGSNAGANPVEYVLAALAGCLNVVAHIVAKEMQFQLDGLQINIEGDLNPAKFSGAVTNERAGFQSIKVNLIPDTDANEDTLNEWIKEVEERCPVSDNLQNLTPVTISIG